MITPYCPMCGTLANDGLRVVRRGQFMGFSIAPETRVLVARYHASCWRLLFGVER